MDTMAKSRIRDPDLKTQMGAAEHERTPSKSQASRGLELRVTTRTLNPKPLNPYLKVPP